MVDLNLRSCPAAQPFLPIFHLLKPNRSNRGTAKFQVSPTEVRELMEHPVNELSLLPSSVQTYADLLGVRMVNGDSERSVG